MFQDKLDEIIKFATTPVFSDEIYQAKEEYGNRVGKIYEDDQSYENRMSRFLEWYIFDRNLTGKTVTPLSKFIEIHKSRWNEDTLRGFMNLSLNVHGLFQVKKITKDHVLVLNYFDKNKYKVLDEQSYIIFRKKDLFEGRIILENKVNRFTGTYCFHPQKSQKFILKEIEKLTQEFGKYATEVKKLEKVRNRQECNLKKLSLKLETCKKNIAKARVEYKKNRLENQRGTLETQRDVLIQNISNLDEKIFELKTVKIQTEGQQAQNHLMHRFAYMNLKWERFRQIDLKDIYKN